jgi:hypothetical protein
MQPQKLASEEVVISAPMSFTGSTQRIWKITRGDLARSSSAAKAGMVALACLLIALAWVLVACWYLTFGLLLVPYRLLRRGSRKRKRQSLQHREMMAAIQGQAPAPGNVILSQQPTKTLEEVEAGEPHGELPRRAS